MRLLFSLRGFILKWITILVMFFSVNASAITITAEYKPGQIIWNTGIVYDSEFIISSISEVYGNLTPTEKWIPVAVPKDVTVTITGNDPAGTTIDVPVHIAGFEYNWGGATFSAKNDTSLSSMTECQNTVVSGNAIAVYSSSAYSGECIAKQYLENSSIGQTPFFFVKPIFNIKDEEALKLELKAASSVGNFTGSTNITFRYYYYKGEVLTYRVLTMPFSLQFNIIESNTIDSVEVKNVGPYLPTNNSNGVIEPLYNKANQTVTGKPTEFQITVKGSFTTGINMTFRPVGGGYYLKHSDYASNNGIINYDIRCDLNCSEQEIVTDGTEVNVNQVPVPLSGRVSDEIMYKILVGYSNAQEFDDVHTGRYSGSFIIEFGLGI